MADEAGNKKKVMIAIEESECSRYALKWVLHNLRDCLSTASLVIFNVQSTADFSYIYAASYGSAHPDMIKSLQQQQKKVTMALLEKAKDICANQGVIAETVTEVGDPKVVICDAVEKLNINLLILGSRGHGALKRAIMGSVSNYCVQNAKCPVLVVKNSK